MCGIAGALSLRGAPPLEPATLRRMVSILRHRGPEAAGIYISGPVALGHARLSIIDLAGGLQPIANEDETLWVIVNGEVYNYIELGAELRARGHRFRTESDSEVVLHLYEEMGPALLEQLNGQFAIALWDARRRRLMLARDRLGVRPLFYTLAAGRLLFGSEVKALLVDPQTPRRPNPYAIDQIFTYWSALPGGTAFEGIHEVPAGCYALAEPEGDEPVLRRYWAHSYAPVELEGRGAMDGASADDYAARLRALLVDATRLRLRADVPVGAYLSGGLDSSAIASIVRHYTPNRLQTFSVAFSNKQFDERLFQQRMARHLGTEHHVVECGYQDIGAVFPDVIWHCETPLLRTAPAPLFLLSALVRRRGLKVVLTGEGADEFFAGYNVFKETLVRRFWARDPASRLRPLLLRDLYDWVPTLQAGPQAYLEAFFKQGMMRTDDPVYSHRLRWNNTVRLKRLFSDDLRGALDGYDSASDLTAMLDPRLSTWSPLSQAQYLEVCTFLTPYLLSSQGDRVAMAHAVEGRFPFLDHRVIELAGAIPARWRMRGLDEKYILKRAMRDLLPPEIVQRPKRPYRAPIGAAFCGPDAPAYVADLLAPKAVAEAGLFNPTAVARLLDKCHSGPYLGENDHMALVGVLSTQLWYDAFIRRFRATSMEERADITTVHAGETLTAAP